MKSRGSFLVLTVLPILFLSESLHPASTPRFVQSDAAQLVLANENLRADFMGDGLRTIQDKHSGHKLTFEDRGFTVIVDGRPFGPRQFPKYELSIGREALTYVYDAGTFKIRLVYELKPNWRFLSKQLFLEPAGPAPIRVREIRAFDAALDVAPREELRLSDGRFGLLLRFMDEKADSRRPSFGAFLLYQNPYNQWMRQDRLLQGHYLPDMDWRREYGPFPADRLCLGMIELSGHRVPAKSVPEWVLVPDYDKYRAENPTIDPAESDALVECVRAFLLYRPEKSIRVHVPWCENDYQIDVATPEGWTEYKRIIDRAAELGARATLFTGGNSALSSLTENRDAWGWENLLFFGLGQKIRKGEWVPAKDPVPQALSAMIDYGKARGLKYLAYAYPSLPFLQDPAWTRWAGDKLGGYNAVDTGERGFQNWWIQTLIDFTAKTGAGGFSFDHWWIAYDDPKATSKYAQWFGCRRILEELRGRVPDVIMDGRQQYMSFGPWTWLGGSYPHPTLTDEQPESFTAFPDLHTDRVSADRQRFAAWKYRIERFAPPEIIPGYITHQTERTDAAGVMRRDRFRPRDWDVLGWKYSLLSSIGTAPFNHTISFIPARDEAEFKALSEADKAWFRGWLDWTDANAAVLKHVKPILGPPMIGRVDGTAAVDGDHGFVFLFNPNYRKLDAFFSLDASIGMTTGAGFILKELYPEEGRLFGKPGLGIWSPGDQVVVPMRGTEAVVIEIVPAPKKSKDPILFNARGQAALTGGRLVLTGIRGEPGTTREILVALPAEFGPSTMTLNGENTTFTREKSVVKTSIRFAGEAFGRAESLLPYDPAFSGGIRTGTFSVPARIFEQLRKRKESWPVPYTEDDLVAPWLGSHRLLLFVQIAEPDEAMVVTMTIDGKPLPLKKAYNSIYGSAPKRTFLGFYADVSSLSAGEEHRFTLTLPVLKFGQFQGLFFENVEPDFTSELLPIAKSRER
jgi:hypothetical protein